MEMQPAQPILPSSNSITSLTPDLLQDLAPKKSRTLSTMRLLLARAIQEQNPSLVRAVHRSSLKYLGPQITLLLMQEAMTPQQILMPLEQNPQTSSVQNTQPSIPLDNG